ncbi:MAG: imidazole glycerol phosphate synthase subunit HisH [Ilumatobacteraceae bacterium]
MFNGRAVEETIAIHEGTAVIAIVDYGAGNLRSVENALSSLGASFKVVSDADDIHSAGKIMLPGVGHFGQIVRELDARGLREAIVGRINAGALFFGVCLGMQVLFESSDEAKEVVGLGVLAGTVEQFNAPQRVPHMGWNSVSISGVSRLLRDIDDGEYFYFANSFFCPVTASTTATATHGVLFSAVVEYDNVLGVQFHPEKSGRTGLRVLQNFVEL